MKQAQEHAKEAKMKQDQAQAMAAAASSIKTNHRRISSIVNKNSSVINSGL